MLRARALYNATIWATYQASFEQARQLGNEYLMLSRELRNDLHHGQALCALAIIGSVERPEGWQALSLPLLLQAEVLVRAAARPEPLVLFLNNCGYTLYLAGDITAARTKLEEAVAVARQLDDTWLCAACLGSLADVEFASGNRDTAEASWQRELELAGQIGGFVTASEALTGLARLALAYSQLPRCLRLLAAAIEFFRRTASPIGSPDPDLVREARDKAQQLIRAEQSEAAWQEGARMSLTQAVRFGLGEPLNTESVAPASASATSGGHD